METHFAWRQYTQQQSIEQHAKKAKKPPPVPRVDKADIKEHMLMIVATCDLVRSSSLLIRFSLNLV